VAYSAVLENDYGFAVLMRFIVVPLFLFGGVFYPVTQLPLVLEQLAYLTPLWHGVALSRELALGTATVGSVLVHVAYLTVWIVVGFAFAVRNYQRRLAV
jgi:lipooligosaccharide transport system permease protein